MLTALQLCEEKSAENQSLREKLAEAREEIADLEARLKRAEERRKAAESEQREKRVLERKLADMEKELGVSERCQVAAFLGQSQMFCRFALAEMLSCCYNSLLHVSQIALRASLIW